MSYFAWRACCFTSVVLGLVGCGGGAHPPAGAAGPGSVAGKANQPWIVLSDFQVKREGIKSSVSVNYRFAEGQPTPGAKYHWIIEEQHGVSNSVSFLDVPVELNASGGTLTTEGRIGTGPGQVATVIALGPRSTSGGVAEPEHASGLLFEGQKESSTERLAPGQETAPTQFGQTVVLANARREQTDTGSVVAVDYKIEKLPEVGRFFLVFVGSEGGSVSVDVSDRLRQNMQGGTLREPTPESDEIIAPLEISLVAEPFGSGNGPPANSSPISNTIQLK